MKTKLILFALLTCTLISDQYAADGIEYKENNKENVNNNSLNHVTLKKNVNENLEKIHNFTQRIKAAQVAIDTNALVSLKNEFDKIEQSNSFWEALCTRRQEPLFVKWPFQSWKQAYGGYIFYPHNDMGKVKSHSTNEHLVFRPDIMFSLIVSASYRNPVAQIDSSDFLKKQGLANYRFIEHLSEEGHAALTNTITNEQANPLALSVAYYLLAKHSRSKGEAEKTVVFFQKAKTLQSKLELLDIYKNYRGFEDKDTSIERYKDLKQEFEGWGETYYIAAYSFKLTQSEKIDLLKEASEEGKYAPALWALGNLYQEMGNLEEANKNFLAYAQAGYGYGYLEYAFNVVGENFGGAKSTDFLKEKELDKIIESAGILHKATYELKDPTAAYWLGRFYEALAESTKDKTQSERYLEKSQQAFIEATRLGDTPSFRQLLSSHRAAAHPESFIQVFKSICGNI